MIFPFTAEDHGQCRRADPDRRSQPSPLATLVQAGRCVTAFRMDRASREDLTLYALALTTLPGVLGGLPVITATALFMIS